jgi:preprotein translocase subunit SecD
VRLADTDTQLKAKDVLQQRLGEDYIVALNLLSSSPQWLAHLGALPMYLGLDLRGGVHFLLQIDMKGAIDKAADRYTTDIRSLMREKRVQYGGVSREGQNVVLRFRDEGERSKARNEIENAFPDLVVRMQEAGGELRLVASLKPEAQKRIQDGAVQQNITILRNRVNELGVSEPIVQRQGVDRINVQLPGVQNSAQVKDILGKTATLEFRLVDTTNNPREAEARGRAPLGTKLYKTREGDPVLLKRDVIATGDQLTDATHGVTQDGPSVFVKLDARGAQEMLKTTQQNLNRPMAVVFIEKVRRSVERDGKKVDIDVTEEQVISVATIRGVFSSSFQITGLNVVEAQNLALLLRAGSLAAPIVPVEERTIGPSLGQDNIERGIRATLLGYVLVVLFIGFYYRLFGVIADIALFTNVVMLVALMSLLPTALTLPGIAGIVLTVGMAVDANVLIFERIREELMNGNSPQASIRAGFDKAYSTIVDSNLTTLIAGAVLFVFGTGPVKGFAVTLSLGIITSMFSAITVTRALVNWIYGSRPHLKHLSIGGRTVSAAKPQTVS